MYFVVECTTTSAPSASGDWRYGVAKVLSTATICPGARSAQIAAMSTSRSSGFVGVSIQNIFVLGRIAARTAATVGHVDVAELQAVARQHAREEPVRPAVEIVGHDDVIAGGEQVHHGRRRRHPRGEREAYRAFSSAASCVSSATRVGFTVRE